MDGLGGRAEDAVKWILLAGILAVAAFLRFEALNEPSYWLDEVLGDRLTKEAFAQPWYRWLIGFEAEHGPLYYATNALGGRVPAALFGLAAIPLVWLASRKQLAAAALLALSPLHIYYSREARPYALIMLLTAALIVALLREEAGTMPALLLLYTSAVAAPIVAAAAVAAFFVKRKLAIPPAIITLAFLLLYRGTPRATDVPPPVLDTHLLSTIAHALTVSAFGLDIRGNTVLVLLALALLGAYALARRDRRVAIVVITMTVLPIVFAIASLKLFGHWFEIRYVCAAVIGFVILAGAGITFLARREVIAVVLVAVIATQTWDIARREPFQKLDWRRIAATIARVAKPGDIVLTAEPATGIVLPYYFKKKDVDVIQMSIEPLAERMTREHPATWIVTTSTRWPCRYPLVLGSALEGFRMHYASPAGDFLRERARAPEFRALDAAQGSTIDAQFFREGWAAPEAGFRWGLGDHASIVVPRWKTQDRAIRVNVLPISPQTMRVTLNGNELASLALQHEWSAQTIPAPARFWVNGLNTLAFSFGHAASPSQSDRRLLAVAFSRIEILDRNAPTSAFNIRIADAFIDEKTAWRHTPSRLPNAHLRRDTVEPLLGRLGFDPELTWPRLQRNELDLDDLIESIAYGSECEDDRTFLTRAYGILFQRSPTDPEMQSLLTKRRKGDSRATILRHLTKSNELRARYERAKPSFS